MHGFDKGTELRTIARSIALDAEAILVDADGRFARNDNLDAQLLAYSISADRVRTGAVPFGRDEMMRAVEQAIEDAQCH